MTTPHTYDEDLDRFETALLAELRGDVRKRGSRGRFRLLTLGGVAATVAAAIGIGVAVGGTSPAFAVHREPGGDISVTINRLDAAADLEKALAREGVRAKVDYTEAIRMKVENGGTIGVLPIKPGGDASHPLSAADCGFGKGRPVTLSSSGHGFVIRIPHESVLANTPLHISTAVSGADDASLAVSYNQARCVVMTQTWGSSDPVPAGPRDR